MSTRSGTYVTIVSITIKSASIIPSKAYANSCIIPMTRLTIACAIITLESEIALTIRPRPTIKPDTIAGIISPIPLPTASNPATISGAAAPAAIIAYTKLLRPLANRAKEATIRAIAPTTIAADAAILRKKLANLSNPDPPNLSSSTATTTSVPSPIAMAPRPLARVGRDMDPKIAIGITNRFNATASLIIPSLPEFFEDENNPSLKFISLLLVLEVKFIRACIAPITTINNEAASIPC